MKYPKYDFNEKFLKETCKMLEKSDIIKIIENSAYKEEMIYALVKIWELKNPVTNDKIEKYMINHIFKKEKNDTTN